MELLEEQESHGLVKVLDHGHVRLVDIMGSDIDIVRAARVSYDAAERSGKDKGSDFAVLEYMMKNKHTTPFEMVELKFDCKMPIFCARQWVRHRTVSINEMSARYTQLPAEFYIPDPTVIGIQSETNKQARDLNWDLLDVGQQNKAKYSSLAIAKFSQESYKNYEQLLEDGVPRELARMCLPLNIYTHWFWKINLHNLMHFLALRNHSHAQWEMRQYAIAIELLIRDWVPQSYALFKKYRCVEE